MSIYIYINNDYDGYIVAITSRFDKCLTISYDNSSTNTLYKNVIMYGRNKYIDIKNFVSRVI